MGIWSNIRSACAVVYSAAKSVAKKVASTVKAGAKKVGKAIAAGIRSFTGKKTFDKAKKLLEDLYIQAQSLQADFDRFAGEMNAEICDSLQRINTVRCQLQDLDFDRFVRLTSVFSEWTVDDVSFDEIAQKSRLKVGQIRSRDELFTIDFDKAPIQNNLKALFTLGFLTRKRASDTLYRVKEEGKRLVEEKAKVEAEKTRLRGVCRALGQVADYFESYRGFYCELLNELEYAICFVRSSYMLHNTCFFENRFDVYFLPKRHLLCLMACEKMTRIMYDMGKRQYLQNSLTLHKSDIKKTKRAAVVSDQLQEMLAS